MVLTTEIKYTILPIEWGSAYQYEIQEVYRMLKDQEGKIFDLSWYDMGGNLFDYVEAMVREGAVYVVKQDNDVAAFFILENPRVYKDIITKLDVHTAVRKKYWGKQSREIMKAFKEYLYNNFKIKKIIASVPQCGYGIIKLLKDIGFTHEGTLKQSLIFKDKNGMPRFYDELIYSLTNEDL